MSTTSMLLLINSNVILMFIQRQRTTSTITASLLLPKLSSSTWVDTSITPSIGKILPPSAQEEANIQLLTHPSLSKWSNSSDLLRLWLINLLKRLSPFKVQDGDGLLGITLENRSEFWSWPIRRCLLQLDWPLFWVFYYLFSDRRLGACLLHRLQESSSWLCEADLENRELEGRRASFPDCHEKMIWASLSSYILHHLSIQFEPAVQRHYAISVVRKSAVLHSNFLHHLQQLLLSEETLYALDQVLIGGTIGGN